MAVLPKHGGHADAAALGAGAGCSGVTRGILARLPIADERRVCGACAAA